MKDLIANAPKTPEGLLAAYIYAQESGDEPALEQFEEQLQTAVDRRRLRALAATLQQNQQVFPSPLRAQVRLSLRYRLVREIGVGGFGKVWLAADERLDDRPVAIKVLSALSSTRDVHRDLERERKALARAQHPGIVPVLDVGEHDGNPFLVMQYVDGITLAELFARLGEETVPPRPEAVAAALGGAGTPPGDWWSFCTRVTRDVLDAVQAAHDVDVVHRDIKPGNVMVRPDGQVVLLDFGVARIVDPDAQGSVSGFTGTLAYMAPEQAGRTDKDFPERVDVYQVGRVLYELLTLHPAVPHDLPFGELLERARAGDIASPRERAPNLPRALEAICRRALEPDPLRRYATAREFVEDLDEFLAGRPPVHASTTHLAAWSYRTRRLLRQHRRWAWTASGLLLGALVAFAALSMRADAGAFVGKPMRHGRQFHLPMQLAANGEPYGWVSVLSSLFVEERRVPLRFVEKRPMQDGPPDSYLVVMELPPGAEVPTDLPEGRVTVQAWPLSGSEARAMGDFCSRLLAWMSDPLNRGRRGVPYEQVREMAGLQARGAELSTADLLGEDWPRAAVGRAE